MWFGKTVFATVRTPNVSTIYSAEFFVSSRATRCSARRDPRRWDSFSIVGSVKDRIDVESERKV